MNVIILLLIAAAVALSIERLVELISLDGLGERTDTELPRSHPSELPLAR